MFYYLAGKSPQILKAIIFSHFFLTILAEFILPAEFWSHAVKAYKLRFLIGITSAMSPDWILQSIQEQHTQWIQEFLSFVL
jgi:hypothetical protein